MKQEQLISPAVAKALYRKVRPCILAKQGQKIKYYSKEGWLNNKFVIYPVDGVIGVNEEKLASVCNLLIPHSLSPEKRLSRIHHKYKDYWIDIHYTKPLSSVDKGVLPQNILKDIAQEVINECLWNCSNEQRLFSVSYKQNTIYIKPQNKEQLIFLFHKFESVIQDKVNINMKLDEGKNSVVITGKYDGFDIKIIIRLGKS